MTLGCEAWRKEAG